ncbi:MAG: sulfotransferase domain-containing protein [Hyphococcus sp.]
MDHRVFVFTVHKAASLGVYDIMRVVAKKEGWPLHSANLRRPNMAEPQTPGDPDFLRQLAGKAGLVGPVRMPVALDDAARARDRFILHLRDPRDVLVSMFYSWSYSHPGVNDDYRAQLREKGVDDFALRQSADLKRKYDLYLSDYLGLPQTTLLAYEEFVLDRPSWLEKFLQAAGAAGGPNRYKRLAQRNPAKQISTENIHAHIRKAAPGDYREKLSLETQHALNEAWGDVLDVLRSRRS